MKSALTPGHDAARCDIPSLLRERLRVAQRRNSRFSLRSFAKQIGIDHSTLSQILRSKRGLSPRSLAAIGKRLGLNDEALKAHAKVSAKSRRSRGRPTIPASYNFDLDTFQMLSTWHHYAILELLQVKAFKPDSRWIANSLGLETQEVNIALQRLLRLGLLQMVGRNRWIDKSGDAEFHSTALTEEASDQMTQEIHAFAGEAIRRVPGRYRIHRHAILAVDTHKLPELKILVDRFLSDVRGLVREGDSKDDVYQLEVSLFPVTTFANERGERHD